METREHFSVGGVARPAVQGTPEGLEIATGRLEEAQECSQSSFQHLLQSHVFIPLLVLLYFELRGRAVPHLQGGNRHASQM